jgi:hypothetical protein
MRERQWSADFVPLSAVHSNYYLLPRSVPLALTVRPILGPPSQRGLLKVLPELQLAMPLAKRGAAVGYGH